MGDKAVVIWKVFYEGVLLFPQVECIGKDVTPPVPE
jgi:hypothetical protein